MPDLKGIWVFKALQGLGLRFYHSDTIVTSFCYQNPYWEGLLNFISFAYHRKPRRAIFNIKVAYQDTQKNSIILYIVRKQEKWQK